MIRVFPDAPGWLFNIDEVSAGVYAVIAKDLVGHQISKIGTDPEALIEECKHEVASMLLRALEQK